jgi:asparagine synthase (glutamine-hydrolysing)
MFAIAIAERDSGDLVLVRDRLGIKPLYTAAREDRLRFASTLPALLAGGLVDTTLDPVALHHYLTFHSVVPAPRTLLNGVRRVEPATLVRIKRDGTTTQERYWQPRYARDPAREDMTPADWSEAILDALRRGVERRMVSDVHVGVLLSGGLDSSLIVALLAEAGQNDLATFSVGFERVGDRKGDEFEYSDLIASRFGTDHKRFRVGGDRLLPALESAIVAMSEPMVSHDVVAFHLLSEEVSKHVTVVQSGQGADEVLAGYDWYPPLRDATGSGAGAYAAAFFDRTQAEIEEALAPDLIPDGEPSRELVEVHFDRPGADEPVDRALRLDTEVMLVDDPVKRVDNMAMAWGLEARVPFLDHDLVELAAACPPELKLAQGGKGVLKEAARRLVPAEVVDRPKGYFPVPALIHLEGPFLDLVRDALRSPAARARGVFRPAYVDRLLSNPNDERTPLGGSKLWQIGVLELWLQAHDI